MDYNVATGDLGAYVVSGDGGAAGTLIPFVQGNTETTSGATLGVGTYIFLIGSYAAPTPSQVALVSAQLYWAAAVAATITVETCNFPSHLRGNQSGQGGMDVSAYTNTTGLWLQQNPSTAIVPVAGSGNSSAAATVTAGGSAAGGCEFDLGNLGARRCRIKVVTTVGGLVRCAANGKLGA